MNSNKIVDSFFRSNSSNCRLFPAGTVYAELSWSSLCPKCFSRNAQVARVAVAPFSSTRCRHIRQNLPQPQRKIQLMLTRIGKSIEFFDLRSSYLRKRSEQRECSFRLRCLPNWETWTMKRTFFQIKGIVKKGVEY